MMDAFLFIKISFCHAKWQKPVYLSLLNVLIIARTKPPIKLGSLIVSNFMSSPSSFTNEHALKSLWINHHDSLLLIICLRDMKKYHNLKEAYWILREWNPKKSFHSSMCNKNL